MAHSIISNIFGFLHFYTIFLCVHCFSNFQKKYCIIPVMNYKILIIIFFE